MTLVNFQIEALPGSHAYISGIVTVNGAIAGRLPLFDLAVGSVYQPNKESLSIQNVTVTLDATAASALNGVFKVSAFAGGFGIGTASSLSFVAIAATNFGCPSQPRPASGESAWAWTRRGCGLGSGCATGGCGMGDQACIASPF